MLPGAELLGGGQSGLAYLLKDRLGQGDELARAIREVAAGGSSVDPTIAARLSGHGDRPEEDREILDLMAKGAGYAEMAAALGTTQEAIDRQVFRAPTYIYRDELFWGQDRLDFLDRALAE